jgi:dipeptidyl aminopeptidase/acylaminoacyl peptidase
MRIRFLGLLCSAMSSIALAQAPVATTTAADPLALKFGSRENASAMSLSPSGRLVAFISPQPQGNGTVAYIADVTSGKLSPFLRGGRTGEALRGCSFVTETRLVCHYRLISMMEGHPVPFGRLIAVNADGSGVKQLGESASFYDAALRQFDGEIIDWLPGQNGSVLMAKTFIPEEGKIGSNIARTRSGLGVTRVDTLTLRTTDVEPPRNGASDYLSDGRGNVRLMELQETEQGRITGRYKYLYRTSGSREWKQLTPFQTRDLVPLAVDAATDSLYALKPLNGRKALYRIKLTDPVSTELVASDPRVDIDNVVRSANGARIVGYTLVDDKRKTVYFDPDYKGLHDRLLRALPKLPLIDFLGSSADDTKVLMFAGSDSDPGRYYVFDRTSKQLGEVVSVRPDLVGQSLASVQPVSIPVGDGTMMPAYLTLPVGKPGKGLPAVVLPHGGPSSRDEWGFDWLAQYLAARGYAVLQPNYRGSAGFGEAWMMQNGFRSWQVSIGDIAAGARWMASQGIADGNRIGIVGWSYGGYAALQAAATQPRLFKAVAAIAPVTDLARLKQDREFYTDSRVVEQFVGNGPHIRNGSPLQQAAAIKVPVLLAHGNLDLNVGVDQSVRMEAALRQAGTPVQFLRFPTLDHQLEDSTARRQLLAQVGALLDRTIGH